MSIMDKTYHVAMGCTRLKKGNRVVGHLGIGEVS
jgi:hypothetical protein